MAKKSTQVSQGEEGFNSYYEAIYNSRWESLKNAMQSPCDYVEIKHGNNVYYIDSASVFCASLLQVDEASRVLDMCAAPGGKSLVIANKIKPNCEFFCNEVSKARFARLHKVLSQMLDAKIFQQVHFLQTNAATLCKKLEGFDSILLDAPCSTERHIFNDKKLLAKWTISRTKTLPITQWSLLSSAYRLLNSKGHLIYATCSLNPKENDCTIQRLITKFPECIVQKKPLTLTKKTIHPESTKYGYFILPDTSFCAGPLYFSLITKP